VPWGRFTQALCLRGRLHGTIKIPAAQVTVLIAAGYVVAALATGHTVLIARDVQSGDTM